MQGVGVERAWRRGVGSVGAVGRRCAAGGIRELQVCVKRATLRGSGRGCSEVKQDWSGGLAAG